MEEDIKIIEDSIKEVEDNKDIGFFETEEDLKFYNAVKYLLKAYKEKEADLYSANSIISEQIDIINNSVSKDKIKEKIKELNKEIKEFKEYVADSTGEERQFYKKQLGQLVSARNELQELLEGDE